jgi:sugar phosphate isomerase/epimerase
MPEPWRYGFSAYPNLEREAFLRRCQSLFASGFSALEAFAVGDVMAPVPFAQYSEAVSHVVCDTGAMLSVHLPTTDVNPLARNRRVRRASIDSQRAGIRWAGQLGASLCVLHLGQVPAVFGDPQAVGAVRFGEFWGIAAEVLAELQGCAREHGVLLTVENLIGPREVAASADRLLELLAQPGCEGVGITVDLSHALLAGSPVGDFVRAIGTRLCHVHANDTDGQTDRHWALGTGQLRLPSALRELRLLGFAGTLVLEIDGSVETLKDSRRQLQMAWAMASTTE